MKAFVIEDNPIDMRLWQALLMQGGHELFLWPCAEGALAALCEQQPDVVLLDLNLAGADGLELVRAMRTEQATQKIPVLAITAYPQRYRVAEIFAAGCERMLVKPVDTRRLIEELQALCS